MDQLRIDDLTCAVPHAKYERVLLAHGGGGKLTADLIQRVFLKAFDNEILASLEDQATLQLNDDMNHSRGSGSRRIAFTTDSFIVRPLFFPGGDIGRLAVYGTVNDLAVGGAIPKVLSAAFILEEGLQMDVLSRIVASMRDACDHAGVTLVTGDTKVVDRGKGDQVFITTSGIGIVPSGQSLPVRSWGLASPLYAAPLRSSARCRNPQLRWLQQVLPRLQPVPAQSGHPPTLHCYAAGLCLYSAQSGDTFYPLQRQSQHGCPVVFCPLPAESPRDYCEQLIVR